MNCRLILKEEGISKGKTFIGKYKVKLEFLRDKGVHTKKPVRGGCGFFLNTIFFVIYLKEKRGLLKLFKPSVILIPKM